MPAALRNRRPTFLCNLAMEFTMQISTGYSGTFSNHIDPDALDELVAHWTRRLAIDGELMDDDEFVKDVHGATTAAVDGLVDESVLRDATLSYVSGHLIACGVSIAAAALSDPLGDPSGNMMRALQTLRGHLERSALSVRDDRALEARKKADPDAFITAPAQASV